MVHSFTEYISEAFTQPVPYKWVKFPDGHPEAWFAVGGIKYEASYWEDFFRKGCYELIFGAFVPTENGEEYSEKNTGTGNAAVVFATIVASLKDFIKRVKPKKVEFSGDKELGKFTLYSRMVGYFKNDLEKLGYSVKVKDEIDAGRFILTRKTELTEAFNTVVPWDWTYKGHSTWYAVSKIADSLGDITIFVEIEREETDNWMCKFKSESVTINRANAYGNTGTGHQYEIFSTVMDILKAFLKEKKPAALEFTGNKDLGKGELYSRMMRYFGRTIEQLGYRFEEANKPSALYFTLTRKDVIEESLDSPVPWKPRKTYHTNEYPVTFQVGSQHYEAVFIRGRDDFYDFMFSNLDVPEDEGFGNTGTGGELQVFSTVIDILKTFLKEKKPTKVAWYGDKTLGKFKLYSKLLQRYWKDLRGLGYVYAISDNDNVMLLTRTY